MNKQFRFFTIILLLVFFSFTKTQAQTAPNGAYNVWYEYGNGKFYKTSFATLATLATFQSSGMPTAVVPPGTVSGIKRIIRTYSPPIPPTPTKLYSARPTVAVTAAFPTINLSAGTSLGIVKSTTDFISGDTLLLALQYMAANNNIKKVAFFYNKNVLSSFTTIPAGNDIINLQHDVTTVSTATITTNQIRVHQSESFTAASALLLTKAGAGYKNGLVFALPSGRPLTSNIFLTMYTPMGVSASNTEDFKLVFLDQNDSAIDKGYYDNIVNHAGLTSHDPNCEIVSESCLTPAEAVGKTLNYEVHFQNTGLGQADTIVTKTTLPAGYTIADVVGYPSINIRWQVAETYFNSNYTVDASYSTGNQIELRYYKTPGASLILAGTLLLADPVNDVTTMGGFNFQLQLKPPFTAPSQLTSTTSIYFDKNDAVVTNTASVRISECCTCADAIGSYSQSNASASMANCLCKKAKRKFWRWLFCKNC